MELDDDAKRVSTLNSYGLPVVQNGWQEKEECVVGLLSLMLYREGCDDYKIAGRRGITLWSLEYAIKEIMRIPEEGDDYGT